MRRLFALLAIVPTASLAAPADLSHVTYTCERNVVVETIYVRSDGPDQIVVASEGHIAVLQAVPTAEGRRFQNTPVVSDYVWWVNDRTAMLGWFDHNTGKEITIYSACVEQH